MAADATTASAPILPRGVASVISMNEILALLGAGLAAGALGGLLGLGGGIVLMPLLRFGLGLDPAAAAGTCVLAVFFTTLGGGYGHYRLGHVKLAAITPIMIAGAIATIGSSIAFHFLASGGHWLDFGIGVVFAVIALRMIYEGKQRRCVDDGDAKVGAVSGSVPSKAAIGALAGVMPGLLGIGTGSILVPATRYLLAAPIKTAMATSLICFTINALISSIFKLSEGYVVLALALPLSAGTLLGSLLGANLNKRIASHALKLVCGIAFGLIALKFGYAWWQS